MPPTFCNFSDAATTLTPETLLEKRKLPKKVGEQLFGLRNYSLSVVNAHANEILLFGVNSSRSECLWANS